MPVVVNLNGQIRPPAEACLSVLDRGFLYGDSVYETVRVYAGRAFMLEEHLSRLKRSADPIGIPMPLTSAAMAREVERAVAASREPEAAVRLIVTRGEGSINPAPEAGLKPNLVVIVRPFERLPEAAYHEGVAAIVVKTQRNAPRALDPNIKSGNFLNNILAAREAAAAGAYEGLMLSAEGLLAEGTTSNVFVVSGGQLATPDERVGLLRGITRELLLELGGRIGLPIAVRDVQEAELRAADEVFVTSTLKEVLPVTRLDGRRVGDGLAGPLTRRLYEAFREVVAAFVSGAGAGAGAGAGEETTG